MNCQDLVVHLSEYIDGALSHAIQGEVEAHLARCHDCHVVLDSTQCTILLHRAASCQTLAAEQRRRLLATLERACRCRRP